MEPENFAAIDLQREYRRALLATRISATVFILLAAGWCWTKYDALQSVTPIFERMNPMVIGGKDDTHNITDYALYNDSVLVAVVALASFAALGTAWFPKHSVCGIIYAALSGVACCIVAGGIFDFAATQMLITLVDKLSG